MKHLKNHLRLPTDKIWRGETQLICTDIRMETHDVCSFFFACEKGSAFDYKPGQFITLEIPVKDETIMRTYTVSASPTRPYLISITVKRVPGGVISNHLHDWLKPGKSINATAPGGIFTFIDYEGRDKFIFLSGGSGITPLMSMSRYSFDLRWDCDIVFCHSARTPDDVIFAKELEMMETCLPSFKTEFYCDNVPARSDWQGGQGFLTAEKLLKSVPDLLERDVFCCGPAPYMENVRNILEEVKYDMDHYQQESFTFDTVAADETSDQTAKEAVEEAVKESIEVNAAADKETTSESKSYKISFKKFNKTIECPADSFILPVGKQAGLQLPFGCTQGICGTCKTRKISGEVEMLHQGGIRQTEIDQGYILPCCSKPLSNLELE